MLFLTEQEKILCKYGSHAFQYGMSEGFIPLRSAVCEYVKEKGIIADITEVVITNGAQGALDAIAKILITKGDIVAVESPTYVGAMTAFNPYEPSYVQIKTDEEGIIPDSLETLAKENKIKFNFAR